MSYLEVAERCLETVSVGTCGKHADFHRVVCFNPCVTHHVILLVVERIENFNGIESTDCLDLDEVNGTVKRYHTPVGSLVCHNCAEIVFAINKLDSGLDIVFMVKTNHHARLVKPHFVFSRYLYFCLELTAVFGIIERSVVNGKSIMRDTPVVAVGCYIHYQRAIVDLPVVRLIEPVHLFEGLSIHRYGSDESAKSKKQFSLHY